MAGRPSGANAGSAAARVRCRRVPGAPVVAVRVWLPGGARAEAIPGTALVAGRALAEGSRRRGWRAIAEQAEARGMGLSGFASYEATGLAIDCLAADLDRALDWAAELALEPAFAADRVALLVRQAEAELRSLADQPEARVGWAFLDQLYRPSPRGRPLQGSAESLARIEPRDCAAFHAAALRRRRIVAVCGDLDEDRARLAALKLFAGVGCGDDPPAPASPAGGERRRRIELPTGDQGHLLLGHLTVTCSHADLAALELLSVILGAGAGLSGRIPGRIRERDGLAYVATAEAVAGAGLDPGRCEVYVATAPASLGRAERSVTEELTRLLEAGLETGEFEAARDYLLGREPFRLETARQWAEVLAAAELYGLPLDRPSWRRERWRRLDRGRVEEAARRHLRLDELRVTIGLPGRAAVRAGPPC